MKNVALLCGHLGIGGAEKLIISLADSIIKDNKKVIVIAIKGGGPLEEELKNRNIKVYNLKSNKKLSLKTLIYLIKIFKAENINIAHTHSFNAHLYCTIIRIFLNIKNIHTEHSVIMNKLEYQKKLDKILIKNTDKVVACSEYVYDNLKGYYNSEKFVYVNNGIDTEKFKFDIMHRENLRKKLNLNKDKFVLITVAMLRPLKNHIEFLKVFKELVNDDKDIIWLIVGDGECKVEIVEFIEKNNLKDNIIFYNNDDIEKLLSCADLFILPSRYEGLPLSILESMSCGVPVIATDVGGVGQVVIDGFNGYKVNITDLRKMIFFIKEIKSNDNLLQKLKLNCRVLISQKYSLENCYNEYKKIYEGLGR